MVAPSRGRRFIVHPRHPTPSTNFAASPQAVNSKAMASQEDLAGYGLKSGGGDENLYLFNADNLQNNMKIVYYCRTFLSIIAGVVAGILGATGLMGFVFYFLIMGVTSLGLAAKAKFTIQAYFDSWNRILLDGLFSGLMSFVLFWTFTYDIVHIF